MPIYGTTQGNKGTKPAEKNQKDKGKWKEALEFFNNTKIVKEKRNVLNKIKDVALLRS